MADEWGSFAIDDEGHPAQRNVLIEDGVLTDYMWDFLRARKEGRPQLGQRPPPELPAPADGAHDQHLRAQRHRRSRRHRRRPPTTACYVAQLGGGQVNTATGDFVFGMTEAYLIENGEITEPLREGNLIGNGPEVLQRHRRRSATTSPWARPARAARTARACRSATASRPCGSQSLTIGGTAA